jgi:hypothetical protein
MDGAPIAPEIVPVTLGRGRINPGQLINGIEIDIKR